METSCFNLILLDSKLFRVEMHRQLMCPKLKIIKDFFRQQFHISWPILPYYVPEGLL